ncbi:helix-turn-helix domain-containing protein [Latilactobacillus curvatus]|uniref:helix-turn-helix domain-containing protein n=1 Tax=Latilactobacillus curvatus TaxID=28038 RepID=UPI001CC1AA75|nr:helix-turn-helix transcriptional regulator [Latilactobacillus curvatus]
MIHYIESHYAEHINLQTLSTFSHYSPQNIIKIFKEVTNLTPTHFIQQVRLQKAVELLEKDTLPINEVAVKVGFTPNYFTKIFLNISVFYLMNIAISISIKNLKRLLYQMSLIQIHSPNNKFSAHP